MKNSLLKIALGIISGRITSLDNRYLSALGFNENDRPSTIEIKNAAEEIIFNEIEGKINKEDSNELIRESI
jgi:hypothetical protein